MWKIIAVAGDVIKAVKSVKSYAEGVKGVPPSAEPLNGKGHITVGDHTFGLSGAYKEGEVTFVITKTNIDDTESTKSE